MMATERRGMSTMLKSRGLGAFAHHHPCGDAWSRCRRDWRSMGIAFPSTCLSARKGLRQCCSRRMTTVIYVASCCVPCEPVPRGISSAQDLCECSPSTARDVVVKRTAILLEILRSSEPCVENFSSHPPKDRGRREGGGTCRCQR